MDNINDDVIVFKGVSKIFEKNKGVKNLNFSIKKGSFHVLIGANGAGKTTMIRILLGIYQKYDGEIFINGINTRNPESFKKVSYISESPIFPAEFSAKDYLMWAGRLVNKNDEKIKTELYKLAEKFELKHFLKNNPNKFSSGQKQKIMLMKILIEDANIIVMDEPTANLDPSARIVFFDEVKKMNDAGKTVFICSHNLDEIDKKATQVTVLKDGEVKYDGRKGNKSLIKIFKEYGHKGSENY